jgi:ribonucleoside-triphosphate reductase (formate)
MLNIIKRNGNLEEFNKAKIEQAVLKAFLDVEGEVTDYARAKASNIAEFIEKKAIEEEEEKTLTIEEIQNLVESGLMACKKKDVARAYILYRYEHALARQRKNDNQILDMIKGQDEYWAKENSNKNPTLVTVQRDYLAGITSTDIAKKYIFPKDVVEAYEDGICHQHDMDYMAQSTLHNCDLINLEDMLQYGTVVNNVKINKPHRLITAMTIATQIMASVASSQYGGQSITLTHLAPFVRDSYNIFLKKYRDAGLEEDTVQKLAKADLEKEVSDAVQTFNYQSSTLFTLNGQAPFCSLFMYINETEEYKDELIMLIKEFFRQRIEGMPNRDGIQVTQAFPKLLYVLQEDNYKPGTKYWDVTEMAVACSSCRLTPDYISEKVMKELKINGHGEGDCFACMGCRSFLSPDTTKDGFGNISRAKNYDGSPKYWGRFNCGVSSINLPDTAFAADGDFDKFWSLLDERLEICHKGLKVRVDRLSKTKASVAPILWMDGALARLDADDALYDLVHNGYATASLGFVGLYECTKIMTGHSQIEEGGKEFAIQVMQKLNDKCEEWKAEENVGYSVYSTPAESLAYKFATKTRERYPEKFEELFGNKKYFENSYHIPSFTEIDPFTKISLEGEFQKLTTGGCLSYIESVDLSKNQAALYPVIEHIYNNIMYCEINIKTSYCHVCGSTQTIDVHKDEDGNTWWECACCGNRDTEKMNVAARTCGYIGTNFWNDGKTQEIASRYINLNDHAIEVE